MGRRILSRDRPSSCPHTLLARPHTSSLLHRFNSFNHLPPPSQPLAYPSFLQDICVAHSIFGSSEQTPRSACFTVSLFPFGDGASHSTTAYRRPRNHSCSQQFPAAQDKGRACPSGLWHHSTQQISIQSLTIGDSHRFQASVLACSPHSQQISRRPRGNNRYHGPGR